MTSLNAYWMLIDFLEIFRLVRFSTLIQMYQTSKSRLKILNTFANDGTPLNVMNGLHFRHDCLIQTFHSQVAQILRKCNVQPTWISTFKHKPLIWNFPFRCASKIANWKWESSGKQAYCTSKVCEPVTCDECCVCAWNRTSTTLY